MVPVVSDARPLIHLSQINKLSILKQLFGVVYVNENVKIEVFDEGIRLGYSDAEIIGQALAEGWLKIEPFPKRLFGSAAKLAKGENISSSDAETLMFASDKKAELLVDDKLLSNLAKMYRLKVWNTWTLLLESLCKDYLGIDDVKKAIDKLDKMKFRLSQKQTQEIMNVANIIEKKKVKNKNDIGAR